MKLLYAAGACSLAPHIVGREADLRFELIKADFKTRVLSDGRSFSQVNPKLQVPTLELDDGNVLTENIAIQLYLANTAPSSGLLPAHGDFRRYQAIEWLSYLATELHKDCFTPLFKPNRSPGYKEIAAADLTARLGLIESKCSDDGYMLGSTFTVVDAYLFTMLRWLDPLQIDISAWKKLSGYRQRVSERPKVIEALRAEGLV